MKQLKKKTATAFLTFCMGLGSISGAVYGESAETPVNYETESAASDLITDAEINVEKIQGLSEEFIMGLDISSVVSEYNSGVVFRDYEGKELPSIESFCAFLKEQGITHIRVRVWNDPYDKNGNGYGGGNNDVDTAVKIAEACAATDLKLLIDFHYSDFWADPGKQQAPKEWKGYDLNQKAEAIKAFTTDALGKIAAVGAEIDMVQIGNETTGAFVEEVGEKCADMCILFQAGSDAVKEWNPDTKVVIHLTNPERENQLVNWAEILQKNNVNYDILATSYYPYWHGALENLKKQLQTVRKNYGKDVMVAETSYAFTLEDTDGHENTVNAGNNHTVMCEENYAFTEQGQADFLRDLMETVNEAGGLGVYYWEPAWITVGDTTGLEGDAYDAQVSANKELWETYGSGWASSYSREYDPDDAGKWYGGSAVDNQAFFRADGRAHTGLHVWNYVKSGAVSNNVSVEENTAVLQTTGAGEENNLPDSKETVEKVNLISDAAAAGFEAGEDFTVNGNGMKEIPSTEDVLAGEGTLHWYSPSAEEDTVTYNKPIELEAGEYVLEAIAMGYDKDTVKLCILDEEDNVLFEGEPTGLAGWTMAAEDFQKPKVSFALNEPTRVKLQVVIEISDEGWGSLDSLTLWKTGDLK